MSNVERAVQEFAAGRFVLILDDPGRENEGDVAIAAECATAQSMNFMIKQCGGLVCMPIVGRRLDELGLQLMNPCHEPGAPRFTVSVDARHGVTSGISAQDRATTVRALLNRRTTPRDLLTPGHLFPLRSADCGLLERQGHTEAAVELACLAGVYPAAVICEVLNESGDAARPPELALFAYKHQMTIVTIADLIAYRGQTMTTVRSLHPHSPIAPAA